MDIPTNVLAQAFEAALTANDETNTPFTPEDRLVMLKAILEHPNVVASTVRGIGAMTMARGSKGLNYRCHINTEQPCNGILISTFTQDDRGMFPESLLEHMREDNNHD